MSKLRLAIFASGRGTNMEAIIKACRDQDFPAEVVVVHCDRPGVPAGTKARQLGLPVIVISAEDFITNEDYERELYQQIIQYRPDLIVLAGYMKILTPFFLRKFPERIINIHPSLLPSFPGLDAQRQALEYGVKISGCTVHFVDEGVDSGPIIMQRAVQVMEGDTPQDLAARILREEHRLYPEVIKLIANNKVRVEGRRVRILKEGESNAN